MRPEFKSLKSFPKEELIFNDDETKEILKFFFPSRDATIDKISIDDDMREFAQGLLVEAIDATYAMGFVEMIFKGAYFKPGLKPTKFMKTFVKKALKHWFKHLGSVDLANVKIYNSVRNELQAQFEQPFVIAISELTKVNTSAFLNYAAARQKDTLNIVIC